MKRSDFHLITTGRAGVEAIAAQSSRSFARHAHDQFGIGVVIDGAQVSHSCIGAVEAEKGDVITVNAGEVHDGAPVGRGPRRWRMLYLDPALVAEITNDITEGGSHDYEFNAPVIANRAPTAAADPEEGDVFALARRAYAAFTRKNPQADDEDTDELLALLLARVMRQAPPVSGRAISQAIAPAIERIDDDPAGAPDLAALAALCGVSRFQLIRQMRNATGFTPHAYVMERRVQLARRRIAEGAGLVDAAIDAGFHDQSHLNRIFTRKFGLTPGAYQQARC